MTPTPRPLRHSPWLWAVCALLYTGLIGPWLISAASTLAVACGIALFIALLAWAFVLFGRPDTKGKQP